MSEENPTRPRARPASYIPFPRRLRQARTALAKAIPYGWRTLTARNLPPRTRVQLLTSGLGWLLAPRSNYRIDLGPGSVIIRGPSARFDATAFYEIFIAGCYRTEYRGRVVVDVGAHRGYYGAYVLLNGARAVYSFEPEGDNYDTLQRAARSFREGGYSWKCERSAITSKNETTQLFVTDESWGHSIHRHTGDRVVAVEHVPARSLVSALDEASVHFEALPVVVKLNIEGAECDVVLNTPTAAWRGVEEVFLAYHPGGDCTLESLIGYLGEAALSVAGSYEGRVYHLARR